MSRPPISVPQPPPALESVLCTEELHCRPSRPPDFARENRALVSLAQSLTDSPEAILQTLAETILKVFECGSAGVSLLTEDGTRFYWPAIAGVWTSYIGGGTPRNFGPCGDVLDRNCPLLFRHPERRYTYFLPVTPAVEECLLAPFYVEGKAVGTIWAIVHEDRTGACKFDNEDLRTLVNLGSFASASYQAVRQLQTLRTQDHERQQAAEVTRELNEALVVSSIRQHELTELAQNAEIAMRKSETRYRRLFESATDGILILDSDTGKIVEANACMGDLMGTESRELVDKELWEIGLLGDKAANEFILRELREKGYFRYEHLPLGSEPGGRIEVEVVANVYRADHESVIQCNIRDVTERSRLEQKLREQSDALANLHRRKDEFLAMLSHELRNPLAPILNAMHLLRLQKNEDRLQQHARGVIERQVAQLTRLVDDMLEVSRITSGRVQLRPDRIIVGGIVERAVETTRPLLDQCRHELTVSQSAEPIWLHADAARLEQVLVNLLTNAAKYTVEGGHIWLTVEQEDDECVMRVRDTGVGIAPDLLPHIFDLFTQAERSLDRSQGGLGIGLALVQRLVEMHRGRVEAHSVMGQGSEFVVHLPVLPAPAPQPPSTRKATAERADPSLRILVVDDNMDMVTTLAILLQESGYDVRTAFDGLAALEAALDFRPNVVLLDIGLPGLNGYEVAKRIRQQPILHNIVLVAMTGYGHEIDRQRSREAGFDHHLVKPIDFGKVQQVLAAASENAT